MCNDVPRRLMNGYRLWPTNWRVSSDMEANSRPTSVAWGRARPAQAAPASPSATRLMTALYSTSVCSGEAYAFPRASGTRASEYIKRPAGRRQSLRPVWVRRRPGDQQPAVQRPWKSNSMVCPLRGRCTGTWLASMNCAVLLPAMTLPPRVATSLAWEGMTALGLTMVLMT